MGKRVCVITAGHLSTCPRMLKAADAFAFAGYSVRVVSTRHVGWAWEADQVARATRSWSWRVVNYDRDTARRTYLWSGARYTAARQAAKLLGPERLPLGLAARAYGRVYTEMVRAAVEESADLFYGGTIGGLAVVATAARHAGTPYGLDLEDFHGGEQEDTPTRRLDNELAARVERGVLPGAAFLTSASAAIAAAYAERSGVRPITINNTFPLPRECPPPAVVPDRSGELRLYWFSQTIGPGRGLEDAVRAMGLAGLVGSIHLRGQASDDYLAVLRRLAQETAQGVEIIHHAPAPPDAMIELSRGYDVGLALEQPHVFNRRICLTNKAFTYMLAGLAIAFTDTPGQRPLADDLGEHAITYAAGDVSALAAGLRRWAEEPDTLVQAKRAAWEAAQRRWHWEHPLERGALLDAVAGVWRSGATLAGV